MREQVHEVTVSQYNVSLNIAELYGDRQQREVDRFRQHSLPLEPSSVYFWNYLVHESTTTI